MKDIEHTIIDFLVTFGLWENDYYSYEVVPTFTKGMSIVLSDNDSDNDTFIPSYIEFDKLHNQLDVVYVNVDDKRDFYHKPFATHTQYEQNKLEQMVHFLIETR